MEKMKMQNGKCKSANTNKNGRTKTKTKKSLKRDERGVSPVIGVIMMIAIVVIIAAVVAAFAYGIIGGVKKAPGAAIIAEGATVGNTNVTFIHHGGDTIVDAFAGGSSLEVRYKGKKCILTGGNASLNGDPSSDVTNTTWMNSPDADFAPGDELEVNVTRASGLGGTFSSGDSISMVYTPTGDILQRVTVT